MAVHRWEEATWKLCDVRRWGLRVRAPLHASDRSHTRTVTKTSVKGQERGMFRMSTRALGNKKDKTSRPDTSRDPRQTGSREKKTPV